MQTMKILIIALLISATAASCQDKYPELEDGLYAEIVTNKGTMVAKLNYDLAPVTVANFVSLAEGTNSKVDSIYKGKKFYNGVTFHRVIDGFMIQGGDPTATGGGNPGYRFKDEINSAKHDKPGVLSMANSGPATNGSQFFITEVATPNLDPKHTVFGELVIGLNVQDSISNVKVLQPRAQDKPEKDVVMEEVNIIRKGEAAKAFDAPKVFDSYFVELEEETKKQEELLEASREKFIKDNENLEGEVIRLPSGVVMIRTKEGTGVVPTPQQQVLIDYAGYLEDGTLFDTSWASAAKEAGKYDENRDENGGYKPFPTLYSTSARLAPGFREAMLNMKVGERARIFIPSFLGYGSRDYGPIPGNSNLIFDIEIVDLVK
nr:peptidylprolyl isomerase [Lacinutrix sp. Hel_I_90]